MASTASVELPRRVGIVIPTLGTREEWLACAVESVENQRPDVKLVIVAPSEEAARVQGQFARVRVLSERRPGIVAAIEAGWESMTDCDVLGWLGDDDQLAPDSMRHALNRLSASPGAAMVYGDYEYVDQDGRRLVTVRPGRLAPIWLRLGQNFIGQPGCLYVREAIVRHGGLSPTLRLAFDVDLHLRLSRDGAVYCSRTLARVRTHASSLTTAQKAASLAEFDEAVWGMRRHITTLARLRPVWRVAGRVYYRFHRTY